MIRLNSFVCNSKRYFWYIRNKQFYMDLGSHTFLKISIPAMIAANLNVTNLSFEIHGDEGWISCAEVSYSVWISVNTTTNECVAATVVCVELTCVNPNFCCYSFLYCIINPPFWIEKAHRHLLDLERSLRKHINNWQHFFIFFLPAKSSHL